MRPAYEKINSKDLKNEAIKKLEKESIKISINNLIDFPFIKQALDRDKIILHGLWHDIGSGKLEFLDPDTLQFVVI